MSDSWSLKSYRSMLECLGAAGYRFVPFRTDLWERQEISPDTKLCLLRHDIDTDLRAALSMAKIENALGIAATYFVMLRSPLYNLFSRANHKSVSNILALGHHLGLHFDHGFDAEVQRTDAEQIDLEARILEEMFEVDISAVSFHQPGAAVLHGNLATGHRLNTYSRVQLKDFHYISDSNRVFPPLNAAPHGDDLFEDWVRAAPPRIQILIHPMWWVYQEASTELVWNRVIESNFEGAQRQFLQTERAYGMRRRIQVVPGDGETNKVVEKP
jgi:hypothetical protein